MLMIEKHLKSHGLSYTKNLTEMSIKTKLYKVLNYQSESEEMPSSSKIKIGDFFFLCTS